VITFRYHIVSIVSVFLALAVGIALGGGPLKGEVDNTLVEQVKSDRQTKRQLQAQVTGLQSGNSFTDEFARTVAPKLIGDRLSGRAVTLVVLPTAEQADVTAITDLVGVAGGTVGATLRVGSKLVDAGQKQLVDELGNQLEGQAADLTVPPDASPYERIGALVARAFGTDVDAGEEPDGATNGILAGLTTTDLLSVEGRVDRRGSLMVFVAGPGEGSTQDRKGTATIVSTLAQAADAGTDGVVVGGPVASAREGGVVKAVRDDVAAARDVSTVDSLGRGAGQVVAVMALADQAAGRTGHFGSIDAADGAMPGASVSG